MKKIYVAVISIVLVIAYFGYAPGALSKYHIQEENQNAFNISFPIMTSVQMKSIQAFIDVLNNANSANSMKAFQDVMDRLDSLSLSNFIVRNYLSSGDLKDDTLNELASTGGFYIIKYDMDETAGDRKTFTMFSTPEAVTATSGMVPEVFKTTFWLNPEKGKYEELQTVEGEALYTYDVILGSPSYNTNFWAAKLELIELKKSFNVDLNFTTDGDPSTNWDDQSWVSSAQDGYTFVMFTPETTGSYTIKVLDQETSAEKDFRLRYTTSTLKTNVNNTNYTQIGACTGSYTMELTAGTKYYFAIQMPSDADTANPYPVTISISKN